MVEHNNTQTVIATKCKHDQHCMSIKRWLKHGFYLKSAKRLFSAAQMQQIAQAVQQAEDGHQGEIQIVIEGSMPSRLAIDHTCKQRAEQLFADHRVWDTEYNSGMLIYLNLCEHSIDIVADRGIHHAVTSNCWDDICQQMLPHFKQQDFTQGLIVGINILGQTLQKFYQNKVKLTENNEINNVPIILD